MKTVKMMQALTGGFAEYLEEFEKATGYDMSFMYLAEEINTLYPGSHTKAYNAFVEWLKNKFPELRRSNEVLVWAGC